MPNRKGKVKPEFEEENKLRIRTLYPMLIDAGQFLLKSSYTKTEGSEGFRTLFELKKESNGSRYTR